MRTASPAGSGFGVWANKVVESRKAANKVRIAKIDGRLQRLLAVHPIVRRGGQIGRGRDTKPRLAPKISAANLGHPATILLLLHRDFRRRALVGAEAEKRRNPPDLVELLVVADIHNLQPIANGVADDSIAEVIELG